MRQASAEARKILARNPKAFHDYHLLEGLEAGVALSGAEVKSVRAGKISLRDGFARLEKGEAFLYNVHISPYPFAGREPADPIRPRKLLLKKRELLRFGDALRRRGFTLVPTEVYLKKGWVKVSLALGKGKKLWDKRESIKLRDLERDEGRRF